MTETEKMSVYSCGESTFRQVWNVLYYWIMPLMSQYPSDSYLVDCHVFISTELSHSPLANLITSTLKRPLSTPLWVNRKHTVVFLFAPLEIGAFPSRCRQDVMRAEMFLSYIPTTIIPLRQTLSAVSVMPEILGTQTLVIK